MPYRRYWLTVIVPLVLCNSLATVARAHPFHASIALVEWNAKSASLEVALRVDPQDLERALTRHQKATVDLDTSKDVDKMIVAYLKSRFVVRNGSQQVAKMVWVGKEVSLKSAWLYFEFPTLKSAKDLAFENRLFFEFEKEQMNTINLKIGKQRRSIRFKPE